MHTLRFPRLLLVALCALTAAHCATPTPAFAESPSASAAASDGSSIDQSSSADASHPGTEITAEQISAANGSSVPSAPDSAPSPADTTAVVATDERDPRERIVDEWFAKHFHGLGAHLTEYLHGRLLVAVEELKALLLELPIS